MKMLRLLFALLTATVVARAQLAKNLPANPKTPAESLVGLWYGSSPAGDEFITFTADGRVFMLRGPAESMTMNYKVDSSVQPWRLNMTRQVKDLSITAYTVFSFPAPDEFAMAAPATDESKRPDAEALKNTKLKLKRITLEPHGGIFQVVEAVLKKLTGSWEGKDGREDLALTFSADGSYSMKVGDFTDKGRFRIDVRKVPVGIDLLSTEGAGVKYSIMEFTAEGSLKVGKAGKKPEERPAAFEDIGTRILKRKAAEAGAEPGR